MLEKPFASCPVLVKLQFQNLQKQSLQVEKSQYIQYIHSFKKHMCIYVYRYICIKHIHALQMILSTLWGSISQVLEINNTKHRIKHFSKVIRLVSSVNGWELSYFDLLHGSALIPKYLPHGTNKVCHQVLLLHNPSHKQKRHLILLVFKQIGLSFILNKMNLRIQTWKGQSWMQSKGIGMRNKWKL